MGVFYQEELKALRSRPGWIYVKEKDRIKAVGKAYERAMDRAEKELGVR